MDYIVDLYTQLHALVFNPDRIPTALAAICLSMIVGMVTGPLAGNANPFFWGIIDKVFGRLGDRLDRLRRHRADLMFRGFLLMAFVLVFGLILAKICIDLPFTGWVYDAVGIVVLSLLLTSGSVWFVLLKLYFSVEKQEITRGSYYNVSRSTRVDLTSTDDFGIIRIAMGYAARSFDKGLVAPVFWYLIGGFTAVFAYSCLAALAWRWLTG